MSKRRFQLVRNAVPVSPGTARELLLYTEWSGDRPGKTLRCPTCNRTRNPSLPNDGHELPDADGVGGCLQRRIIDEPAGGAVVFKRHSEAFPDATGCDTCQLFETCSIRKDYDFALIRFGPLYVGINDLIVSAGDSLPKRLLVSHALLAEVCDLWDVRTE